MSEICRHKFDFGRMAAWLAGQSPLVQETARIFPIPDAIPLRDQTVYAIGYGEGAEVSCISVDPRLLTCEQFNYHVNHRMLFEREYLLSALARH